MEYNGIMSVQERVTLRQSAGNTKTFVKGVEAVDLFCGVGGLTHGLRKSGIKVVAGIDNDATCEHAYKTNNRSRKEFSKFIHADLTQYGADKVEKLYSRNSIKVLVGCAPCQPFSLHTTKNKNKQNDDRWNLLRHFGELVKAIKPEIVSMENVRGIVRTDVFRDFLETLESHGYKYDYRVVYAPDYGAAQSRHRLILLASRRGEIKIPAPTYSKENYRTVRDIIGGLPPLKAGQSSKPGSLHRARKLADINLKRIGLSKPKGTWRDWPKELLPNCYRKKSGQTYSSVYGRMDWDGLAPTITTQFFNYGSGRFGHPEQDRALSLREGALLQTFPKEYDFGEVRCMTTISRHIGNAVPPDLGEVIGDAIKQHIRDYPQNE